MLEQHAKTAPADAEELQESPYVGRGRYTKGALPVAGAPVVLTRRKVPTKSTSIEANIEPIKHATSISTMTVMTNNPRSFAHIDTQTLLLGAGSTGALHTQTQTADTACLGEGTSTDPPAVERERPQSAAPVMEHLMSRPHSRNYGAAATERAEKEVAKKMKVEAEKRMKEEALAKAKEIADAEEDPEEDEMSPELLDKLHQLLDEELNEKQEAIDFAQTKLERLQSQLAQTAARVDQVLASLSAGLKLLFPCAFVLYYISLRDLV